MNVCNTAAVLIHLLRALTLIAITCLPIFSSTSAYTQTSAEQNRRRTRPDGKVSSESVLSQLREAARLLELGKPDQAEPILRSVISAAPRNSDAHNLLGTILDQRLQFKEAEREYREALRLNPNVVSPLANLGVLLARTGRSGEAVTAFENVLRKAPDHPQATLNLGLQYVARGDYVHAVPMLERASQLGLDSYQVRLNLGTALYYLKRYDEAVAVLESAAALSPAEPEPLYYLGLIHWSRNQDETAADFWDRAVQLRPNFPAANFMLGEALRRNRRTEASVEFYKRALDQDPGKFAYYARLGGIYIVLGQPVQALAVFRQGLVRFPRLPEAHYFAGVAARAAADYETAATELRKALALEPRNVNTLAQLGFVLLERGEVAEAESVLQRAVSINDKHFYANYDLGRLFVRSRRYDQALPLLQHAATLKPNNPNVHYQLFVALSRLKRKDEAERELTAFKQLDEERKARPRAETDIEDEDVQNPAGSSPP